MNEKPIILRRLKTKDGIVSSIEELAEYRFEEMRRVTEQLSFTYETAMSVPDVYEPKLRRYRTRRQVHAILIEMEEI